MNPLRQLRASLDAMLSKHEIDVCRLFAVWWYCCAVTEAVMMFAALFHGKGLTLQFGIILYYFMGRASWAYKSWPRTLGIVFSFLVIGVLALLPVFYFCGAFEDWTFHCTVGFVKMEEPPAWVVNMVCVWGVLGLLLFLLDFLLLFSWKIRDEIYAAQFHPAPQTVSRLNKRIHRGIMVAFAVYTIGGIALPHVTDLKKYEVKTNFTSGSMWDGTHYYVKRDQSLFVFVNTNRFNTFSYGSSSRGRKQFIEFEGYPKFQFKKRTKYTLENGAIREEPWEETEEYWK